MLGEHYEFIGLMVSLYLKGLLDTGEYFVVGVDTRQYDPTDPQKYLEGMWTPGSMTLLTLLTHRNIWKV